MTSCSAIRAQGREDEGGSFAVMEFAFPRKHYACQGLPAYRKGLNICLPMGSSE